MIRFFRRGEEAVVKRERDAVEWEQRERRGHAVLSEEWMISTGPLWKQGGEDTHQHFLNIHIAFGRREDKLHL